MARAVRITVGFVVLAAGMLMLVLPGPGILTVVAGLAILARDLEWAERVRVWAKRRFLPRREGDTRPPEQGTT